MEETFSTPSAPVEAPPSAPMAEPAEAPRPGFLQSVASSRRNEPSNDTPVESDPLNIAAQRSKLLQMGFGDNTAAADEIIRAASRDLRRTPELWNSMQEHKAWQARLDAAGDQLERSAAIVEMAKIERRLQKAFADFVTVRVGRR